MLTSIMARSDWTHVLLSRTAVTAPANTKGLFDILEREGTAQQCLST